MKGALDSESYEEVEGTYDMDRACEVDRGLDKPALGEERTSGGGLLSIE